MPVCARSPAVFGTSSESGSRALLCAALGAALFMLELTLLDRWTQGWLELPALIPPFGASAVIVFFTPEASAARPWNVVVGQLVSAFAACAVLSLAPGAAQGVQAGLSVALAASLMLVTRSLHPPGGATALFAVVLENKLGFAMLLCPMLIGALALVGTRFALDAMLGRRLRGAALPVRS